MSEFDQKERERRARERYAIVQNKLNPKPVIPPPKVLNPVTTARPTLTIQPPPIQIDFLQVLQQTPTQNLYLLIAEAEKEIGRRPNGRK